MAFCEQRAPAVRSFLADAGLETATWRERHARPGERLGFVRRSIERAIEFRKRRIDLVHCADLAAARTCSAWAWWHRLLDAMDVFVLSTHWEGLPLVLIEAMAPGLAAMSPRR